VRDELAGGADPRRVRPGCPHACRGTGGRTTAFFDGRAITGEYVGIVSVNTIDGAPPRPIEAEARKSSTPRFAPSTCSNVPWALRVADAACVSRASTSASQAPASRARLCELRRRSARAPTCAAILPGRCTTATFPCIPRMAFLDRRWKRWVATVRPPAQQPRGHPLAARIQRRGCAARARRAVRSHADAPESARRPACARTAG